MPTAGATGSAGCSAPAWRQRSAPIAIGVVLYGSLNRSDASNSVLEQLSAVAAAGPDAAASVGSRRRPQLDHSEIQSPAHRQHCLDSPLYDPRASPGPAQQPAVHSDPALPAHLAASGAGVTATARRDPRIQSRSSSMPRPHWPDNANRDDAASARQGRVDARVVELVGGILPGNDGQELDNAEVTALVRVARGAAEPVTPQQPDLEQVGVLPVNLTPTYLTPKRGGECGIARRGNDRYPSSRQQIRTRRSRHWTAAKSASSVSASRWHLVGVLRRMGATSWQSRAMVEAATKIVPDKVLPSGNEVRVRLVPHADRMEPEAFRDLWPAQSTPGHRQTQRRRRIRCRRLNSTRAS